MILRQVRLILLMIYLLKSGASEPVSIDTASLKSIANVSYAADSSNANGVLASMFSPRMDFDQWKPLTGRGDPLRNDPTYDYEPPVLERVRYWADDTRLEREHYPERKSEVLMLGVSSRKPSAAPRPSPPRRHHRPPSPPPLKYEDYSYKLSEHYPMTILVPPPPPPPGHKPSLYVLTDDNRTPPTSHIKITTPPKLNNESITVAPEHLTSLYALQEANLIYQSSTTSYNWILDLNKTSSNSVAVSSDYAGWGPTTPISESDVANDTHNLISIDHIELPKHPYSFYKPMLSEAPPPPRQHTINPLLFTTFVPTINPPLEANEKPTTTSAAYMTWPNEIKTTETPTSTIEFIDYNIETTTDDNDYNLFPSTSTAYQKPITEKNIFDMLRPMLTMPLVNGPERPEDNLYAHASEHLQVYKEHETGDMAKLETMQTMQPPPPLKNADSTIPHRHPVHINSVNSFSHKKPALYTQDPYLNMRYTTPMPTIASPIDLFEIDKSTTEAPTVPMYLIIQGHSKVKTYGSQPKLTDELDTVVNEISKPNESNEVKHLHPIKEKVLKTEKKDINRRGKLQNLKSLVDEGRGSIEIQETDVGIKYDVSDGSEVPIEIYKKGIVDNEENNYKPSKKTASEKRIKRQIDLEDILPFDEDTLEEYVYNFLKTRSNSTGITGLIAQAVTGNGKTSEILDDLEDDDEDDDSNEER